MSKFHGTRLILATFSGSLESAFAGLSKNIRRVNFQRIRDAEERVQVRCPHLPLDVADDLVREARPFSQSRKRKITLEPLP